MKTYDIILIGAGSIGVPAAMALGERGVKTAVIDKKPSPGQGENKHAIGGIRATHSDPGKILAGIKSLEVFSTWQEKHGDDIEWLKGGYLFPVYREKEERLLKGFLPIQKKYGLNIDYISPEQVCRTAPGINTDHLMGGTFSPDDGSASPLISTNAFYRKARGTGHVDFYFKEKVGTIHLKNNRITGLDTDKNTCSAPLIIDAAGGYSRDLGKLVGIDIPVIPDSHEGGITEPVKPFFKAMVVDLREASGSKNYYFYQNRHGQIVFCITPDPPIVGTDKRETSIFLPQVSRRMVDLMPRLKNIRVRRVWRGLYPMTPDGSPLVGENREVKGLIHATGMCGQGYMLGPGIGETIARLVTDTLTEDDGIVLDEFSLYREFGGEEALK
ncbi:MAG: FAD-binding oxidoreductase [Thermodesulfobacteriota bacterium]|nr:FAD-binding oxidoreductase [Thermodesulfobacteriota bacterium]